MIAIAQAKTPEEKKRIADDLIQGMKLDERYKDVTFETLNRDDFLASVKVSFPQVNWDRAYEEFKAAGQSENKG